MNSHNPINTKRANITILIMIIIAITFASVAASAQIHHQDEDRYSTHLITDNVIFKGIFYAGVEFQAEFNNGVYIRPQIHYAKLKDGYLETSLGMGLNLSLNRWNNINVYSGIKLGVINRAQVQPIFGIETGVEVNITDKLGLGIRGTYDVRGDAHYYDENKWKLSGKGYIKFII